MDIFIKGSAKRSAIMAQVEALAQQERRTVAGMAWFLILEALTERDSRKKGAKR